MVDVSTMLDAEKELVRKLQKTVRAEVDRQRLTTWKAASLDSQIAYSTLLSYFPADENAAPAELGVAALRMLLRALPATTLSVLLPDEWQIVRLPDGVDFDVFEDWCRDFLETKGRAHHVDSPAGREISDCERDALAVKIVPFVGKVAA
jgi:hypothetical protein